MLIPFMKTIYKKLFDRLSELWLKITIIKTLYWYNRCIIVTTPKQYCIMFIFDLDTNFKKKCKSTEKNKFEYYLSTTTVISLS